MYNGGIMTQKKIFMPTLDSESWQTFLAEPEKHWKDGYSAKQAAESWEKAGDIPKEIRNAFKGSCFEDTELLMAIPEFKVPLPGGTRPSQNDLLLLLNAKECLVVATVEAKTREDFDETIIKWTKGQSDGKKERLDFLLKTIQFPKDQETDALRYQLFHRLASAVIMAEKFHASKAMMIIQSFEVDDSKNHFRDYAAFVGAYGIEAEKGIVQKLSCIQKNGMDVYVLWVNSKG
jgi:hypothetical protein